MWGLPTLFALIGTGFSGCGTDQDTFIDNLRFGTSSTGFTLVGEASSFSLAATGGDITFRLESTTVFDNRFVRLYIESTGGNGTAPYAQKDYTGLGTGNHIMLSSFRITDVGNYKVRAVLVEEIVDIGRETPITQAYLYMQP